MHINEIASLFKSYDVRGKFPIINKQVAFWIGVSLIEDILISEKLPTEVILLRDCRLSSPELYTEIANGIKHVGGTVRYLGEGSTDMLYAACQLTNLPGLIITASHNPSSDNGVKIVKQSPQMVSGDNGLMKIRDKVAEEITNLSPIPSVDSQKTVDEILLSEVYQKLGKLIQQFNPTTKQLKIVVDGSNGMGGLLMEQLKSRFSSNIQWIPLYWERNGHFPHHNPDPSNYENLVDLQTEVLKNNADFGVCFDGDADRAFFVDNLGEVVHADFAAALMINQLYKTNSGPIVSPITSSKIIQDTATKNNTEHFVTKQGHTYIKQTMQEKNGLFGAEYSGHFYFRDFGYMDSGILALSLMVEIVASESKPLSEIIQPIKEQYFPSQSINLSIPKNTEFQEIIKLLEVAYKDAEFSFIDGVTIRYPNWQATIRFSNTEAKLRLIVETRVENETQKRIAEISNLIINN
jgi:phosphomannomutase